MTSIPNCLKKIEQALADKGLCRTEVSCYVTSGTGYCKPWCISIRYRFKTAGETQTFDARSEQDETTDWAFTTLSQVVLDHIANLPSPEEAEHEEFLKLLARVVEKGKDIGVDGLVLNPLIDSMKRLSENVITHRKDVF